MRQLVCVVATCVGSACARPDAVLVPVADGEFRAEGPRLGTWTFEPSTCFTQDEADEMGVGFVDHDGDDQTQVVVTTHLVLILAPRTDGLVSFYRQDCTVLDLDLHSKGVRVNGKRGVVGSVRLSCEQSATGKIEGSAIFWCD